MVSYLQGLGGKSNREENQSFEDQSNEFNNFCKEAGIKSELTTMYTLEQNGVAERKNGTIVEAARAMLYDKCLLKFLWGEAVNTVVYVQNRCSHSALESKKEIFSGKKLDVSHFRVFGFLFTFMCWKKREKSWMLLERRECLWATVKFRRHIESMCLVKEKWRYAMMSPSMKMQSS